jgi:HSP20 family protein
VPREPEWSEHPFDILIREVNALFDIYRGGGRNGARLAGSAGWELSETEDEIRVRAELPGLEEKDIQVAVDEEVLTLRGERKRENEKRRRDYHIAQMHYGSFSRTIPLPAQVDGLKAKARFKCGVLTLTLPKTKQARGTRRHIPVTAG